MSKLPTLTGLLVGATLLLSACTMGASGYPAATAAPASPAATASAASGATVGTATAGKFGTVLVGPDGRTLYTHAGDNTNASTCTGDCLTEWPPLTIAGGDAVTAGSGVTGTVGSFMAPDGSKWVTYGGMPLYYWEGDAKPGDATGQGIDGFAVVPASGTAAAPTNAPAAPPSTGGYSY